MKQLSLFEKTVLDLKLFMKKWFKAYEDKNEIFFKNLYTQDSYHFGTGKDEILYGDKEIQKQLKRDWSQIHSCTFQTQHMNIRPMHFLHNGPYNSAWVTCETIPIVTNLQSETHKLELLRCTFVLSRLSTVQSHWQVAHSHVSWAHSTQEDGQSYPREVLID